MQNKKLTLSDLIEIEYRETDRPSLVIHESRQVERILKYVIEELTKKEVLKVSFNAKKQKEFTQELKEDCDFLDLFDKLQDELLCNIINNILDISSNFCAKSGCFTSFCVNLVHRLNYLTKLSCRGVSN